MLMPGQSKIWERGWLKASAEGWKSGDNGSCSTPSIENYWVETKGLQRVYYSYEVV